MAAMVDARMVKAKQAWQVLQGKLISLGWWDKSTRIVLFEVHVISAFFFIVLAYGG